MKGFRIVTKTDKGKKALTKVILEDNKFLEDHKEERETKIFFAFFERIIFLNPPSYLVQVKTQTGIRKAINRIVNKNVLLNNLLNKLPEIENNAVKSLGSYGAKINIDYEVVKIEI